MLLGAHLLEREQGRLRYLCLLALGFDRLSFFVASALELGELRCLLSALELELGEDRRLFFLLGAQRFDAAKLFEEGALDLGDARLAGFAQGFEALDFLLLVAPLVFELPRFVGRLGALGTPRALTSGKLALFGFLFQPCFARFGRFFRGHCATSSISRSRVGSAGALR